MVEGEADNDCGRCSSDVNNTWISRFLHAHGPDSNKDKFYSRLSTHFAGSDDSFRRAYSNAGCKLGSH